jgi:hypothetical protein
VLQFLEWVSLTPCAPAAIKAIFVSSEEQESELSEIVFPYNEMTTAPFFHEAEVYCT